MRQVGEENYGWDFEGGSTFWEYASKRVMTMNLTSRNYGM